VILGIDTATLTCGVALWDTERAEPVAEYALTGRYIHSEKLVPMIAELLREAAVDREQLTAVAVTAGPGSFTGLRIGFTAAKTLAYAWGLPLIPVSTLDVLAGALADRPGAVAALLDARNRRVYAQMQLREGQNAAAPGKPRTVVPPAQYHLDELLERIVQALEPGQTLLLVGSGARAYQEVLREGLGRRYRLQLAPDEFHVPRPAVLCRLAAARLPQADDEVPLTLVPNYLRPSSAEREKAGLEGGGVHGSAT